LFTLVGMNKENNFIMLHLLSSLWVEPCGIQFYEGKD
jgi:hypothetical protein